MAVCSVLELIVYADSFRNIDLYNQGHYCLRFALESDEGLAVPTFCESQRGRRVREKHNVSPAETDNERQTFDTRVFTIQFKDEEVRLHDLCVFRCHVKVEGVILMRVQLLFNESNFYALQGDEAKQQLRVVAEAEFRLIRAEEGLQSYVPVTFGDVNFCVADVTVHSVLLNCRLNLSAPNSTQVNLEEIWASILFPDASPDLVLDLEPAEDRHQEFSGHLQRVARELRAYIIRMKDQLPSTVFLDSIPEFCEVVQLLGEGVCTPRHIAEQVLRELADAAAYLCQLNLCLRELLKVGSKTIKLNLRRNYYEGLKDRVELSITKKAVQVSTYAFNSESNRQLEHLNASKLLRSSQDFLKFDPFHVEDLRFLADEDHPLVFEDHAYTGISETGRTGLHLMVLAHGYQGNSFDLSLLKNYVQLAYPRTVLFASDINQGNPDAPIEEQAERFAREVLNYIEASGLESRLCKLSFLGHSMGGLVIRAALPLLSKFSSILHSYISLSTPHLGVAGKSTKLVGMGIWFLKKWNKSASLRQLSMTDAADKTKTYLFRLSSVPGLNFFRYVVLLSSHQDSYAPFESARVEVSPQMADDKALGGIFLQMGANLLMQLKLPQLVRLDVNFSMKKRNLDSMIGRKAHIQFLENEALVRTLVLAYPQFFN
jgi:pimeloyl-ACP methyl ester carboxylesterase